MSEIFVDLGTDVDPVEYVSKIIRDHKDRLLDENIRHADTVFEIYKDHERTMNEIYIKSQLSDVEWDKFIKQVIKKVE